MSTRVFDITKSSLRRKTRFKIVTNGKISDYPTTTRINNIVKKEKDSYCHETNLLLFVIREIL